MALPHRRCHPTTTHMLLLIFLCITSRAQSQNSRSGPTISQCGTGLMPLAPCAPFVQGRTSNPAQSCCVNLRQVYNQQTACLCLLMNQTTLSSFPINQTLALQLPVQCNLQVDMSTCSGMHSINILPYIFFCTDYHFGLGSETKWSVSIYYSLGAASKRLIV